MFKIDIPSEVKLITHILNQCGYEAYVVGGCVRDSLLGIEPHDWDICTNATPEKVCDIFTHGGFHVIETGLQHGTVTVNLGVRGQYEITTFRVDGEYSDNRRPDLVEFVGDVIEDLGRRDFTINAMVYNDRYGLVDPWNGSLDIHVGLIRCVRNPDDRFREDALRIMRALRFASTYGFRIEEKTAAAIHRNKDLLKNISAERIQSELTKMLCGPGVLDILLEYSDVMAVIIPELEPCIGFDQNNPYHIYDIYDHIAHAVAFHKGIDNSINMALLLHDIGKPHCYTEDHNGGHFYGHGAISHKMAKDILERLRFDNKTKEEVLTLVLYHDAIIHPDTKSVKRWMNRIGPEMLDKLIFVRIADVMAQSKINQESRRDKALGVKLIAKDILAKQQCFSLKDLAINGYVVIEHLGVPSGPKVGEILNYLLNKVLEDEIENNTDALIEEARRYLERETEKIVCDKATDEWFKKHPGLRTTVARCEKCGLYFKPSLGHECEVE